ncbi:MAG: S8 family serine peptidase [Candidatus Coatesbacteria bacterium]|nr:S8 family serine peptidase [Candidatus Coatesbacteria bacterium]
MRHAITSNPAATLLLLLVGFLTIAPFEASAGDLVVSLSSRSVKGMTEVVRDGEFLLPELERTRRMLEGGPPEPVVPSHSYRETKRNSPKGAPDLSLLYKFEVPDTINPLDAAYRLSKIPGVEWAEPMLDLPRFEEHDPFLGLDLPESEPMLGLESTEDYVVPNDPLFPTQGCLFQMHLPEAWAISTGSTQVVICAIDSGFMQHHEDMIDAMWENPEEANGPSDSNGFMADIHGWNFGAKTPYVADDFSPAIGHGVNCTSVYAARGNNGIGMAGLLWDATVMITVRDWNNVLLDGCKCAVYAADNGARIAHMGAGGPTSYCKTAKAMIEYSRAQGLLIYSAAGNECDFAPRYPAAYRSAVAVAGVDRLDVPTGTNYGYWTGASAPLDLEMCRTCIIEGGYGYGSGTSIANPYAAGVAALTLSLHQDWDPDLLQAHIRATSTPTDPYNPNVAGEINRFEIGPRVDAYASLSTEPRVEFSAQTYLLRPLDPGENQFELFLVLENCWKEATNIYMHVESDDPMVSVEGDPIFLGEMRPLQILVGPAPHIITVDPACPANHQTSLNLILAHGDLLEQQNLSLDVVVNRGITALQGWPSQEFDPQLYPPIKADLNGDGIQEIVCPTSMACFVFTADGEKIDEIPVVPMSNTPAVADLDGDLADELIFQDIYHRVHIYDEELGIMTITDSRTWPALHTYYMYCAGAISTANLGGNSGRQVLVKTVNPIDPSGTPVLSALNMDGSNKDGFPLDLFVESDNIAAVDFDGDGTDELAFIASGAFYAVDASGEVLPNWPIAIDEYQFTPETSTVMISAGDLDGDGVPEVVGTVGDNRVFALKVDGTVMSGWPFIGSMAVFKTHPVIADVNGDGKNEVVMIEAAPPRNTQLHRGGSKIHVIDHNGQELPGWPIDTDIWYLRTPITCDLNSDGKQEIIVSSSRGAFAYNSEGQIVPGWPIIVAPRALGIYSYSYISIDDFNADGRLEIGIPMEGRFFIFSLDNVQNGAAKWGYRDGTADMRYSQDGMTGEPSLTIHPKSRRLIVGMDSLNADIRISNPGEERTVVASAWIEAFDQRFYLPDYTTTEQNFTLTLPRHFLLELKDIVNIPLPEDLSAMEITIAGELSDASLGTVLSSPSERISIEEYYPPGGEIVVEGLVGASWQTFSYRVMLSSYEPEPMWFFDDGATSSLQSPGHLFETTGYHTLGLILTDERGGQDLVTASTIVFEQAAQCPDDMVSMGSFCIDKYEASRPDSTYYSRGTESGAARSIPNVFPWLAEFAPEANTACALAGKRLCSETEWRAACTGSFGSNGLDYPYGNTWVRYTCGDYYSWRDSVVMTGDFPKCVSRVGVYDMVGNAWEIVTDATGVPIGVMGGSTYEDPKFPNCSTMYSLAPEPWGMVKGFGFRCCKDAE